MRLVSLALLLVFPGFARPYPAAERAARYTVYHRAINAKIRVKLLISASKCANKGQLTDLMPEAQEAKPVFLTDLAAF
jgi:hypothetical protein